MLSRTLRTRGTLSRQLCTTQAVHLPRIGRPRPPPISPASSSSSRPADAPSLGQADTRAAPSSEVPWFLQREEDVEVLHAATPSSSQLQNTVDESLPEPLSTLHYLLTEGDRSSLIARPDGEDGLDSTTGKRPLTFIHAKAKDEEAWADWIVVVQVKSSAAGSVSRVAKEVGSFLKHALPPSLQPTSQMDAGEVGSETESAAASSIEDFLGQSTAPPAGRTTTATNEPSPPAAKGSASEERGAWRPFKIISREAQEGLKALHSSEPEKWSRQVLAQTFKISPESVRRILKSKWQPSGQQIGRQNRRAMEREKERRVERGWMKREQDEVALIRSEMEQANEGVDEDEQEYRLQGQEEEGEGRYAFTQPVFYEGLVHSGEDRTQGRGKSAVTRGDGEWCLVDAGWCVVHVMTARARQIYDVESVAAQSSKRESDATPHL